MKKQIFKIDHGTFVSDVLVCIGAEDQEIISYIEKNLKYKLDDKEINAIKMDGVGRTAILSNGAMVLRLKILKYINGFHSNVAHEIFHAVEFLFENIGIKHHINYSGEAFAYQIQHLTYEFYSKIKL